MLSEIDDELVRTIRQVAEFLNADNGSGHALNLINNMKIFRYLFTLLYITRSTLYDSTALIDQNIKYFTIYMIVKHGLASSLGFKLDATHQCRKHFTRGINRGWILHIQDGRANYYTLTKEGEKYAESRLNELLKTMDIKLLRKADVIHTKLNDLTRKYRIRFDTPSDFKRTEQYGFKVEPEIIKLILKIEKFFN